MLRRTLLASASALALLMPFDGYARFLLHPGAGGGVGGGVATQIATLTLVNTSGSTQAAGGVTPIFGWAFKKGDVPTGTAPQFLVSSVPQPYSWGCQSYYSDGSLCWAMFMLRTTPSIGGNGTLSVGVWNGGTAPSASSRTLTEVYALGLQVNMTGASPSGANLSGTWSGFLKNDANNIAQYVYMDGQAGTVWRVETEVATTSGGTPHGQLYTYHYIAALQDASGALGGFRHVAKITQPWYNVDSPAKNWRAFSASTPVSVTWTGGGGGTNNLPWPVSPVVVTGTNGSQLYATPSGQGAQFYVGAGFGSDHADWNITPGYFTSNTDSALNTTQIFFAVAGPSAGTDILAFRTTPNGDNLTLSGGGTATFNPVPVCLHFGALWTLNTAAKWSFIKGAGSMSADATIRTQFDANYFQATGLLPPRKLSLVGSVTDINATFVASYPNWSPISGGPIQAEVGATGAAPYLGPMTAWSAHHFLGNQSAQGEQVNRQLAYAGSFSVASFRDHSTRNLPNLGANAYSGMTQATTLWWYAEQNPPAVNGFTSPPANNTNYLWQENNTSHKPSFTYYTCLVFGGPDMLDLLLEQANGSSLNFAPSLSLGYARNYTTGDAPPGAPLTNVCTVLAYGAGARGMAWACRDWVFASNLVPHDPTNSGHLYPDGSAIGQYVTDQATAQLNFPMACLNANIPNVYAATTGFWNMPLQFTPSVYTASEGGDGFFNQYFALVMGLGAAGRIRNNNASSWIQKWATWRTRVYNLFGGWHLYTETDRPGDTPYNLGLGSMAGLTPISIDSHWGITKEAVAWIWSTSFVTGSTYIQIPLSILPTGWTPANGDKWMFDPQASPGKPGSNFSVNTPYYTRDTSISGGNVNFNLALAPTGAANWFATTAYSANDFVQPTSGNAGSFVYNQTGLAGGTSGGSAPTWPQTIGNSVSDGPLTWTCIGTTAVIVPNTSGTTLGFGFSDISGPWLIAKSPPVATSGATPFVTGAESYLTWANMADCQIAAALNLLGVSPPAGFTGASGSATVIGDGLQRVASATNAVVNFAGEANWAGQATF